MPIYELECRACGKKGEFYSVLPTDKNLPCPRCGGETDRLYSLFAAKVFQPFTTSNILEDGSPITVRGPGQLSQLQNEHGVQLVDDPGASPPQTRFRKPSADGEIPGWWGGGA